MMQFDFDETAGGVQARLVGELTIYQVKELLAELNQVITLGKTVEVDLFEVSEIDTAGVQALLFAKRLARSHDIELRFVNHSKPVVEVIDALNVSGHFGDPIVMSIH